MKILAVVITTLFLIATSSVAQIRYAFANPSDIGLVLLNFAMAFSIFMIIVNSSNIKPPKGLGIKLTNLFTLKRQPTRAYKVS